MRSAAYSPPRHIATTMKTIVLACPVAKRPRREAEAFLRSLADDPHGGLLGQAVRAGGHDRHAFLHPLALALDEPALPETHAPRPLHRLAAVDDRHDMPALGGGHHALDRHGE